MQPIQIYLGVPQTAKLPVYEVIPGNKTTIKQLIFTNTDTVADSKITITVNTTDIMKDYVVKAGDTKIIDANIILDSSNTLVLQQEKTNAINVMINGITEPIVAFQ
ncbi:hypothetical protein CN272_11360 [Bacillus anthracis]|nr:hypothetical protein CN272_11360 [Bacillus anthracis]